jgi:chemotaxis protein methyltransferase CheR
MRETCHIYMGTGYLAAADGKSASGKAGWPMTNNESNQELLPWQRTALDDVIAVMHGRHGMDVSCYEESFLVKSLEKRRQATAAVTPSAYLQRLSKERAEAENFFRSLRVICSGFFRNPLAFALLEQMILPGLVEEKVRSSQGELRIWSAGCAAGQEAWSVAILLEEAAAARQAPVPFRIFATDVSEAELDLALRGVYSAEAVGNVRSLHLGKYFSRQGESFALVPWIRQRVDFSICDLLDVNTSCPPASIYGHFDLVLCSNVLLYYRPEAKRFILDKLRRSLMEGGYLLTGETERQIVESAGGFRTVAPPASVFQRVRQIKGG